MKKKLVILLPISLFLLVLLCASWKFPLCAEAFIYLFIVEIVSLLAYALYKCIRKGLCKVFKDNLPQLCQAIAFRTIVSILCVLISFEVFYRFTGSVPGIFLARGSRAVFSQIEHIVGYEPPLQENDRSPEPLEQEPPDRQESPTDTAEKPVDPEQLYAPILEKYRTALTQGYDMWQLRDAGLNYMCAYHDDASEIGYAFLDVDQNGTPELLIGEMPGGDYFLDYYTVIDGTSILVAQSSERDRYYLCADGAIANEGSNSAFSSFNAYYTVGAQGQLILSEAVIWDEDYSSDNAWYSTSAVSAEGASPLSWESAELIYKKHEYVEIEYVSFFPDSSPKPAAPEPIAEEPSATSGKYDDIMGTYVDENYNGIYMFIGYGDSSKTTAYVALALPMDDFSVEIQDREGSEIYASDYNESISSEPGYIVDLDCSQTGKIVASIYISEYDYSEDIVFVPCPDSAYPNPYYVG